MAKHKSGELRCPATALIANSDFKNLLVEGALFNSGIEIQCVSEHVWVGHGGLRGRGGELPAGGIRASQGTFSSFNKKYKIKEGKCTYFPRCYSKQSILQHA